MICWLIGHKFTLHIGKNVYGYKIFACERCLKKKAAT